MFRDEGCELQEHGEIALRKTTLLLNAMIMTGAAA